MSWRRKRTSAASGSAGAASAAESLAPGGVSKAAAEAHDRGAVPASHITVEVGKNWKRSAKTSSSVPIPVFDAKHIKSGRVLAEFLGLFVRKVAETHQPRNLNSGELRVHTIAEVCSGSCVTSTAASELNRIFRAENVPHRFKTAYICELADNKRDFGCDVLDPGADVDESDSCAFKDLCDLHKLHVPCYRRKKRKRSRNSDGRDGMCTVPRAEGIVGGILCKATCAPSHKRKISNP